RAAVGGAGEQILHRAVVLEVLAVHRVRDRRADAVGAASGPVVARVRGHVVPAGPSQPYERLRISDWQFTKVETVDRAEERSVGADSERERQHHHRRPAFSLKECANAVSKVSQHGDVNRPAVIVLTNRIVSGWPPANT